MGGVGRRLIVLLEVVSGSVSTEGSWDVVVGYSASDVTISIIEGTLSNTGDEVLSVDGVVSNTDVVTSGSGVMPVRCDATGSTA